MAQSEILLTAADMVRTKLPMMRITEREIAEGAAKEDVAVVPLGMPLLAGPGSMATVVVLMGRARAESPWHAIPVLLSIAATAVPTESMSPIRASHGLLGAAGWRGGTAASRTRNCSVAWPCSMLFATSDSW